MTKITYTLLVFCLILLGTLYYVSMPQAPDEIKIEQQLSSGVYKTHREISYSGNLYTLFESKTLSDFSQSELVTLLTAKDSDLLRDLAIKFDNYYVTHPKETVKLLGELADEAIQRGLFSNFLQFSAHVQQAQELNQIEFNLLETWLTVDRTACYEDYLNCKTEVRQPHRLSLMTAVYIQNQSLDIEELLAWGDGLEKERGILAHKLSIHSTEESRVPVNAYFKRNIDQPQVQASLIPLLEKTPEHLADSQMEWLATVDLSRCEFTPTVVGALFACIARTNPDKVVDTLNETDYLEAFLTPEQQNSNLADFHYQELYDHVLFNYIQSVAEFEFEHANVVLDYMVNPHLRKASEAHIERLLPYYEQQQQLLKHQNALGD